VKSTASSNDIQKKNRVLKYIILFCFVFLKDFAFFSSFSSSSFFFFFFFLWRLNLALIQSGNKDFNKDSI
jgi:hypothetical protein